MTKELRRLSILMLFMFFALFASTSWIQVLNADDLAQNSRNTRALYDSYEVQRGSIIASGSAIASSVPSDDVFSWQRVYTDPDMWAPVTGYINPALGPDAGAGIELAMNSYLSGTAGSQFLSRIERIFTGQSPRGSNVALTLDADVQRAAYEALGDLQGGVIAIEPSTGRILAMVTSPSYDTNLLASHNTTDVNTAYDALVADPGKPLSNRAIAGDLNDAAGDVRRDGHAVLPDIGIVGRGVAPAGQPEIAADDGEQDRHGGHDEEAPAPVGGACRRGDGRRGAGRGGLRISLPLQLDDSGLGSVGTHVRFASLMRLAGAGGWFPLSVS